MSTKRSHPSGYQKRSAKAKKLAASVKGVAAINSLFQSATSSPTVTSEHTRSTRTLTGPSQPPPPDITMQITVGTADADVAESTITANAATAESADESGTSGHHSRMQDHSPTLPGTSGMELVADCIGSDEVDVCNRVDTSGADLTVVDTVRDEFFDNKYPSDRGHFNATVTDTDITRKIVMHGPCQPDISFPPNEKGRRFSADYYSTTTKTGMKIKRQWLCYSVLNNTVYCESCWLFANRNSRNFRSEWVDGVNDWKHLSEKIKIHQQSDVHIDAVIVHQQWKRGGCIEEALDLNIREERSKWIKVLSRLFDITLTLAENNLAFRGDNEVIGEQSSGNFLALVGLVARYDTVLEELIKKPDGTCKYLSPSIQNELISEASTAVKNKLLDDIRSAPFYTVIADGTQDITKNDQFSCVIRYVLTDSDKCTVEVKESFLGFFHVVDQSAKGIEELLKSVLSDIDISKCRGQGYDGASVMSGKLSGVHKRFQDCVPNAVYVHCNAHNLNLVLCDAAEESIRVKNFFAIIQEVYNYLGGSAPRWAMLRACGEALSKKIEKNHSKITIKKLCPTR
jgi:hypothetical protein